MKTWIITDTHFGHRALVSEHKTRDPGFEMEILESLKEIKPYDTLIHLGDFALGNDKDWIAKFMKAITYGVNKILVRGNHDFKSAKWYTDRGFHMVCESFTAKYFGKMICFSHKPLAPCNLADINVHGHLHGNDHRVDETLHFYDGAYNKQIALEWSGMRPVDLRQIVEGNVGKPTPIINPLLRWRP